ncbi:UdgX family uracil-DNA binding protein [Streptomyces cavernicola]|uniref:Type-4 uracil-DNA glycosylase n=1 Tax=Streptomyces cavernicola TaxID=3043613 RepID=A0ABT6SFF0_9ACTN|nr:UdgX family uracil-DNA binding protein [Streptomyces sp. B-S-A6]MDI3406925.1 UdgX family uracil-DNA binding protein [Streptomyces sp. B-S-A6]
MPGPDADADADADAYDATPFVPERGGLDALRKAAARCEGCPLFREATQTVFGKGRRSARVVLLGEQPGDQEDRRGEPFVGPAGHLLMRACSEAEIDPAETYVTNAVKHFKFVLSEERGKRRIHKPPTLRELAACRPWLSAELRLVEPELIVALGATAGKALYGSGFRVTQARGAVLDPPDELQALDAKGVVATIHPAAVLRAGENREEVYAGLVSDLRVAAAALSRS